MKSTVAISWIVFISSIVVFSDGRAAPDLKRSGSGAAEASSKDQLAELVKASRQVEREHNRALQHILRFPADYAEAVKSHASLKIPEQTGPPREGDSEPTVLSRENALKSASQRLAVDLFAQDHDLASAQKSFIAGERASLVRSLVKMSGALHEAMALTAELKAIPQKFADYAAKNNNPDAEALSPQLLVQFFGTATPPANAAKAAFFRYQSALKEDLNAALIAIVSQSEAEQRKAFEELGPKQKQPRGENTGGEKSSSLRPPTDRLLSVINFLLLPLREAEALAAPPVSFARPNVVEEMMRSLYASIAEEARQKMEPQARKEMTAVELTEHKTGAESESPPSDAGGPFYRRTAKALRDSIPSALEALKRGIEDLEGRAREESKLNERQQQLAEKIRNLQDGRNPENSPNPLAGGPSAGGDTVGGGPNGAGGKDSAGNGGQPLGKGRGAEAKNKAGDKLPSDGGKGSASGGGGGGGSSGGGGGGGGGGSGGGSGLGSPSIASLGATPETNFDSGKAQDVNPIEGLGTSTFSREATAARGEINLAPLNRIPLSIQTLSQRADVATREPTGFPAARRSALSLFGTGKTGSSLPGGTESSPAAQGAPPKTESPGSAAAAGKSEAGGDARVFDLGQDGDGGRINFNFAKSVDYRTSGEGGGGGGGESDALSVVKAPDASAKTASTNTADSLRNQLSRPSRNLGERVKSRGIMAYVGALSEFCASESPLPNLALCAVRPGAWAKVSAKNDLIPSGFLASGVASPKRSLAGERDLVR